MNSETILFSLGSFSGVIVVSWFAILKPYLDSRLGKAGDIAAQLEKLDDIKRIHEELKEIEHSFAEKLETKKASLMSHEKVVQRTFMAMEEVLEETIAMKTKLHKLIGKHQRNLDKEFGYQELWQKVGEIGEKQAVRRQVLKIYFDNELNDEIEKLSLIAVNMVMGFDFDMNVRPSDKELVEYHSALQGQLEIISQMMQERINSYKVQN